MDFTEQELRQMEMMENLAEMEDPSCVNVASNIDKDLLLIAAFEIEVAE